MPLIEPDLSEVVALAPIPAGTYPAKITDVEAGIAKSSGNAKVVVKFDVEVDGKTIGRQAHMVITGQGAFGFEQLLRATHFDDIADKYKAGEKVPFNTDNLIGQELNVVIEADSYNGAITDKIRSYIKK